jgi:hypothetical protein
VECIFWVKGYNLGEGYKKQGKEKFIQEGKTPSPQRLPMLSAEVK